jgi:murein DD-endopeptidase MepM/ murein hydrolase activator NlpD
MRRLRLPIALAVFLAALVFAFEDRWPWPRLQVAAPIVVSTAFTEEADTLRRGETLGELFLRQGLASFDVTRLFGEGGLDPRRLRAGLVFSFRRAIGDSEPTAVEVRTGPSERLRIERGGDLWDVEREAIAWDVEVVRFGGEIGSSLYEALDQHVPDQVLGREERVRLAWDMADVFAWSVDFTRDIQPGDEFAIVVERRVSEEGEARYGRVLAAELTVAGKPLTAFRFEQGGQSGFYDAAGRSLRRAFLRAPVQFRRISSSYSRSRLHPILKVYRRHAGIDYSASAGTPVLAAGDGTVVQAGWAGGYGNLIEIRHRNGVSTRYGHLRGFAKGLRAGTRVGQGEAIGYVGSTGLSTAAHLHYEFLLNGRQQDPRALRDADGPPVDPAHRTAFEQLRGRYADLLAAEHPSTVRLGD